MNFYTIALNTAVDTVIQVNNVHPDGVAEGEITQKTAAGKGLNVARDLQIISREREEYSLITVLGFVGQEESAFFEDELARWHLQNRLVPVPGHTRENITILQPKTEQEQHIKTQSYTVHKAEFERFLNRLNGIPSHAPVFLCGSLPAGISNKRLEEIMQTLKRTGARVICDTAPAAYNPLLPYEPALLKPNVCELEEWAGSEIRNWSELSSTLQKITGDRTSVLLSLGAEGAIAYHKDRMTAGRCRVSPERIRSTVGAGDSLLASFVFHQLRGLSMEDCLTKALAFATANCLHSDTGNVDLKQAQTLEPEVKILTETDAAEHFEQALNKLR